MNDFERVEKAKLELLKYAEYIFFGKIKMPPIELDLPPRGHEPRCVYFNEFVVAKPKHPPVFINTEFDESKYLPKEYSAEFAATITSKLPDNLLGIFTPKIPRKSISRRHLKRLIGKIRKK